MSSQQWNAKQYQQDANFVSDFGRSVSDLLNSQANEAILDLGCGTGELAEQIAQSGAQVYGVDASASQYGGNHAATGSSSRSHEW
ncbi:MAG: class I SAM-dependent methyltransferase [Vibrio sp.]